MRQFFGPIDWERKAIVFFLALLILVVVGPFGTYNDLPLARRFVFWTILMIGIGFFMQICMHTALVSPRLAQLNRYVRLMIGSAIAAIPSAGIVGFVEELFRGTPVTMDLLRLSWFQITIMGFVIGSIEFIVSIPSDQQAGTAPPRIHTAFHERLKQGNRSDIISMSMQDHYVEVTTSSGKELVLIRFSDALVEIKGLPGQRIHRSHWVATAHLRKLEKDGPRHLATLSDGRTLPVSATYADQVEFVLRKKATESPIRPQI